jgi:acyl dehydratase
MPLQWLHTNALAAYNIAFVLSFVLSGFFTFLLTRRLVVRLTIPDVRAR